MTFREVFDEIQQARKDNEWLLPILLEEMATSREVPAPKHDSWFSVSKVPATCPRAIIMIAQMGIPMSDSIEARNRWHMDRGSAMHSAFQERWLGPMGWLKGGWTCPMCGYMHGGVGQNRWTVRLDNAVKLPEKCQRCKTKWNRFEPFGFVEPYCEHPEPLWVKGRNDGFLCLPGRTIEIMDLKTTTRIDLVKRAPRPGDVEQVQWYLEREKLAQGRLIYVNPGAKEIEDGLVEHLVIFDPKLMHQQKEKVLGIRKAIKDRSRPPHCPTDRKGTYGECDCVEVEKLWRSSGH